MNQPKRTKIDTRTPFDNGTLMKWMYCFEQTYPFFQFEHLCKSILDHPIPIIKLGKGSRKILYVGAHHGMEWITSAMLVQFVEEFCYATATNRRIGNHLPSMVYETHTLYVIPMLNPDGVEYQIHGIEEDNPLYTRLLAMNHESKDFSHWQANARGVDLNHNYDAGFEEYKTLESENGILGGAPTRYSGESSESEPEVRALCNFIRYHSDLRGVMSLHTQGEEIFYKSGSKVLPQTRAIAARLANLSGYCLSNAEGLASYGGLTDWCVQKMNLPAFTVECGKGKNPLPFDNLPLIYGCIRNMLFSFPLLL